jgi:hypothetical protein
LCRCKLARGQSAPAARPAVSPDAGRRVQPTMRPHLAEVWRPVEKSERVGEGVGERPRSLGRIFTPGGEPVAVYSSDTDRLLAFSRLSADNPRAGALRGGCHARHTHGRYAW